MKHIRWMALVAIVFALIAVPFATAAFASSGSYNYSGGGQGPPQISIVVDPMTGYAWLNGIPYIWIESRDRYEPAGGGCIPYWWEFDPFGGPGIYAQFEVENPASSNASYYLPAR